MHYPFLVVDPRSGLQFRLTDNNLAELSLAPIAREWSLARAISETPDPVCMDSIANAPIETISAVTTALEDLVLATPDLCLPVVKRDRLTAGAGALADKKTDVDERPVLSCDQVIG